MMVAMFLRRAGLLGVALASLAFASLESPGCEKKLAISATPGGPMVKLMIEGRPVHITLPAGYKEDVPASLIVGFHDQNMTIAEFDEVSQLSRHKSNANTIIAYPETRDGEWQSSPKADFRIDDLPWLVQILDSLSEDLCLDTDRIYAVGLGMSAGMAHLAACDRTLSKRFAAYASINGAYFRGPDEESDVRSSHELKWEKCEAASAAAPARILSVHGLDNQVFDYLGKSETQGYARVSGVSWLVEWAIRNGCGRAMDMPLTVQGNQEQQFTRLRRGSLVEGMKIENVMKASYQCWAPIEDELYLIAMELIQQFDNEELVPYGDVKKDNAAINQFVAQRLDEVMATAQKAYENRVKQLEETRNTEDGSNPIADEAQLKRVEDYKTKGKSVLTQYMLFGAGHGWPRLVREGDSWTPLTPETDTTSLNDSTVFDTTAEVFKWFEDKELLQPTQRHDPEPADAATIMQAVDNKAESDELVGYLIAQIKMKVMIRHQMEWQAEQLREKRKRIKEMKEKEKKEREGEKDEL